MHAYQRGKQRQHDFGGFSGMYGGAWRAAVDR